MPVGSTGYATDELDIQNQYNINREAQRAINTIRRRKLKAIGTRVVTRDRKEESCDDTNQLFIASSRSSYDF